jgi:hypothetical protein
VHQKKKVLLNNIHISCFIFIVFIIHIILFLLGYFANLEWEPCNLQYLDCAFNLYQVLVTDSNGINFLGGDRRGMLFNEMARELESKL